jgi:hypothetical protein
MKAGVTLPLWLAAALACKGGDSEPSARPSEAQKEPPQRRSIVRPPQCETPVASSEAPEFLERRVLTGVGPPFAPVMALIDYADDDTHADLVIGSSMSYGADVATPLLVTVLLGNGSGELLDPLGPYEFGAVPLTLADFDGDVHTDFASPARLVARDAVRSAFSDIRRPLIPPIGQNYWGDINGDRSLDYATADLDTIVVGLGNPDGTFDPTIESPVAVPYMREGLLVDVNADQDLDLVGVQFTPADDVHPRSVVDVLRGDGEGRFISERSEDFQSAIARLRFGDFDCDGWADLVLAFADGRFEIRFGAPEGWIASGRVISLSEAPADVSAIAGDAVIADVNGDRAHDVVTVLRTQLSSGAHDAVLLVHVGDGRGGFSQPTFLHPTENPMNPVLLAAGDLDEDGKDDIVAIDPGTGRVVSLWDSQ